MNVGDLGDSAPWNIGTNDGGHIIGAPVYSAPEVVLHVPWTAAVDIWALGATVRIYTLSLNFQGPLAYCDDRQYTTSSGGTYSYLEIWTQMIRRLLL